MRKIILFISLLLLAALALFIVQNLESARLRFLGWEWNMSLAVPVLSAYILGGLSARPIWRLLNSQRKQGKEEKKPAKQGGKQDDIPVANPVSKENSPSSSTKTPADE